MEKKEKNEYVVLFKGTKLSKREANKVGLSIIFGIIGVVVSIATVGTNNKIIGFIIVAIFALFGYFIGNKIFKKNHNNSMHPTFSRRFAACPGR